MPHAVPIPSDPLPPEIAHEIRFALGLTAERPQTSLLGIDPSRLRGFAARFMARHKLKVVAAGPSIKREAAMKPLHQQVRTLADAIGAEAAVVYRLLGVPDDDARRLHATPLGRRLEALDPADELGRAELSGLFGLPLRTILLWDNTGALPEPDRVEKRGAAAGPRWALGTIANWMRRSCCGRHGPNRYVAGRLGL